MYKIDWNLIKKLEGFSNKGYVPKDEENDKKPSGVTIGAGFDIGQFSIQDLVNMGLSTKLVGILSPYTQIVGKKASKILKEKPLYLDKDLLNELTERSHLKFTKNIVNEYDSNSSYSFKDLTSAQQTVIISVGYQYGSLKRRCPTFFKYITECRWNDVIIELENFRDSYPTRRNKEANLLKKEKERLC